MPIKTELYNDMDVESLHLHRLWLYVLALVPGLFLTAVAGNSTASRKTTVIRHGTTLVVRLGESLHPQRGRALTGARHLAYTAPWLCLARGNGVLCINLSTSNSMFVPLPEKFATQTIHSLNAHQGRLWLGTDQGWVLRYRLNTRSWTSTWLGRDSAVWTGLVAGKVLALEQRTGGNVYVVQGTNLQRLFTFDQALPITPLGIRRLGSWYYVNSDTGLLRFNTTGRASWELLGTRDHLGAAIVQEALGAGKKLILATSQAPVARIPANVKKTSYGTFYYDYFQDRLLRREDIPDPAVLEFRKINKRNTHIPQGGLWLYTPYSDRARRLLGAGLDFFSLADLGGGVYLAASRRGLYRLQMDRRTGSITLEKAAVLSREYIDGLLQRQGRVFVLLGDRVLIYETLTWGGQTRGGERETRMRSAKKTTDTGRDYSLPGGDSEGARFIREIETYLRSLKKQ